MGVIRYQNGPKRTLLGPSLFLIATVTILISKTGSLQFWANERETLVHNILQPKAECYTYQWSAQGSALHCPQKSDGITDRQLPLILGVGPTKSGSTVVFAALDLVQSIAVGNATLGGQPCCLYELYFFSSPDRRPLSDIESFYTREDLQGRATWLAEKTPGRVIIQLTKTTPNAWAVALDCSAAAFPPLSSAWRCNAHKIYH